MEVELGWGMVHYLYLKLLQDEGCGTSENLTGIAVGTHLGGGVGSLKREI